MMRNRSARRGRLVALAVTALVAGVACGSPAGGQDPTQLIAASADATTAAGSARMSMQMTMTTPQGDVVANAEGAYDFARSRGEMTMQMELPPEAGSMAGPNEIEMVFEDLVIYMKYPMMAQVAPGSKPWIRMDLEKMGRDSGMDLGSLMQSGNSDPSRTLDWLRGVSGDVEVVGEEDVRGVTATHYRGEIDFDKVVEQAPDDVRDALTATIDTMTEAIGSRSIPFDVWIDDQGRTVRFAQSFDFDQGASAGAATAMTMDFYDFGAEVDIVVPPASQTTDFDELVGAGAGAAP